MSPNMHNLYRDREFKNIKRLAEIISTDISEFIKKKVITFFFVSIVLFFCTRTTHFAGEHNTILPKK